MDKTLSYELKNRGSIPLRDIMLNLRETCRFEPGDKVTYISESGSQRGIVKSTTDSKHYVFVVYNCDNNWDKHFNYTAARTATDNLITGWV